MLTKISVSSIPYCYCYQGDTYIDRHWLDIALLLVPGTPPKRLLVAKTSMEITPHQDAKTRGPLVASKNPAAEKLGKETLAVHPKKGH